MPGAAPKKTLSLPCAFRTSSSCTRASSSSGSGRRFSMLFLRYRCSGAEAIEGQVEQQHVDAGLTEEPQGTALAERLYQLPQPFGRNAPSCGHTVDLDQCRSYGDVRVEAAA